MSDNQFSDWNLIKLVKNLKKKLIKKKQISSWLKKNVFLNRAHIHNYFGKFKKSKIFAKIINIYTVFSIVSKMIVSSGEWENLKNK